MRKKAGLSDFWRARRYPFQMQVLFNGRNGRSFLKCKAMLLICAALVVSLVGCESKTTRARLAPQAQPLVIAPEIVIPATVKTSRNLSPYQPRIATGPTGSLVTWTGRLPDGEAVYGVRLRAEGTVVDSAALLLARGNHSSVSFDGSKYLLSWVELGLADFYFEDVRSRAVATSGALGLLSTVRLSNGPLQSTSEPSSAFNGTQHLVVQIAGEPFNALLVGAWVTPQGAVSGRLEATVSGGGDFASPKVAAAGSNFFAVWQGKNGADVNVFGAPLMAGSTTAVSGATIAGGTGDQKAPSVACSASACLVAWSDAATSKPFTAVVSASGTPLRFELVVPGAGAQISPTAVDFDGTQFVMVWGENAAGVERLVASRFSPNGVSLDANPVVIDTNAGPYYAPDIAWDGSQHVIVWHDAGASGGVFARQLTAALAKKVTVATRISNPNTLADTAVQHRTRLALEQQNLVATWIENYQVRKTRISQSGVVLDAAGAVVANSGYENQSLAQTVNGTLLVTIDERAGNVAAYSKLLPLNNQVLAGEQVLSGSLTDVFNLSLAPSPNGALAFVSTTSSTADGVDLLTRAIAADGAVRGSAPTPFANGFGNQTDPTAVWLGTRFLVAYSEWKNSQRQLLGKFVDENGVILSAAPLVLAAPAGNQTLPQLVRGAGNSLLVFEQDGDVRAALLDDNGNALRQDIAIAVGALRHRFPRAAFDGQRYLVVWNEYDGTDENVLAREVLSDGTVEAAAFSVAASAAQNEVGPDVVALNVGRFAVSYNTRNVLTNDDRAVIQFVTTSPQPDGAACQLASECSSLLCDVGRCSSVPDSGTDASVGDGGLDASVQDAGTEASGEDGGRDASVEDGGIGPVEPPGDGGISMPDAGEGSLGTPLDKTPLTYAVGCNCSAGGESMAWWLLAGLLNRFRHSRRVRKISVPTSV